MIAAKKIKRILIRRTLSLMSLRRNHRFTFDRKTKALLVWLESAYNRYKLIDICLRHSCATTPGWTVVKESTISQVQVLYFVSTFLRIYRRTIISEDLYLILIYLWSVCFVPLFSYFSPMPAVRDLTSRVWFKKDKWHMGMSKWSLFITRGSASAHVASFLTTIFRLCADGGLVHLSNRWV